MEFTELIAERFSVRAYKSDPVEEEKLNQILEAARLAPTADNRQPFLLLVIPTAGREAELQRIYGRRWFSQPPLVICACALPERAWVRKEDNENYADVDVAIVMDHLILAAANLGLGTCWIAAFNMQAAREILPLPEGAVPVAFTPLGYPDAPPPPKKRKPLAELVQYL